MTCICSGAKSRPSPSQIISIRRLWLRGPHCDHCQAFHGHDQDESFSCLCLISEIQIEVSATGERNGTARAPAVVEMPLKPEQVSSPKSRWKSLPAESLTVSREHGRSSRCSRNLSRFHLQNPDQSLCPWRVRQHHERARRLRDALKTSSPESK